MYGQVKVLAFLILRKRFISLSENYYLAFYNV